MKAVIIILIVIAILILLTIIGIIIGKILSDSSSFFITFDQKDLNDKYGISPSYFEKGRILIYEKNKLVIVLKCEKPNKSGHFKVKVKPYD